MKAFAKSLVVRLLVAASLMIAGGSAGSALAQTATSDQAVAELIRGSIQSPPEDARVAPRFTVSGTVSGKLRHLWLAVRIGDLYWPKEPQLVPENGRWTGQVNEGGNPPGGRFDVVLLDVSEATSAAFAEWLRKGHLANSYPGIPGAAVEGAKILDRRSYRLAGS